MFFRPADEAALATLVRDADAPLLVQGNGTKAGMLRPVQAGNTLSTGAISGITLYAPNELVMSAKAGTPLAEIESALAARGQQMIAEPPHFFAGIQTIGGMVATNLSGPRRVNGGAMRDHVLGVRAVNGDGEILKFGGRVLKNVTGLDVSKLLTGSFGTLAVLTEITFKVLPVSESSGTILFKNLNAAQAVRAMSAALGAPFSVSGAAYLPARKMAALRIEDFANSVSYRLEKLGLALREFGTANILPMADSVELWRDIRDGTMLDRAGAIWRISVKPSAAPGVLQAAEAVGVTGYMDWGGGLLQLAGPADETAHAAVTAAAQVAGGVWWLMQAPESLRAAVDVVPPEAPALRAIAGRMKASFDSRGILNPGKLRAA